MKKMICLVLFGILPFCFACSTPKYSSILEKEAIMLIDRVEESSVDLHRLLVEIEGIKLSNSITKMQTSIDRLDEVLEVLKRADADVDRYLKFVQINQGKLEQDNLGSYIGIREMFGRPLKMKRKAIRDRVKSYRAWLVYSAEHYRAILNGGDRETKTYESLLIQYNMVLKRYNTLCEKYLVFVEQYSASHPELVKKFRSRYRTLSKELGWR